VTWRSSLRAGCGVAALVSLTSCDSPPNPLRSSEGRIFEACQAERGLSAERYVIFATSEASFTLCDDKLVPKGQLLIGWKERFATILSEYTNGELPGKCSIARRAVLEPIRERVMTAFRMDGSDAYCAWVSGMIVRNHSKLWTRFWAEEQEVDRK
jgi:hypothetical protein